MVAKAAPKASAKRPATSVVKKPVKAANKKPAKEPAAKKPAKSGLVCVRVELATYCGRCMRPVLLDRVADRVTCRACLHTRPLAIGDWMSMGRRAVKNAAKGKGNVSTLSTDFGEEYTVRSRIGLAEPTCNACSAVLTLEAIVAAVGNGAIVCGCGSKMSVRAADPLGRAVAGNTVAIANERVEPAAVHAKVMFRCGCGAGLAADGSERAVRCDRCGPVDVPEALWNVLRPVRPRSPIFFVLKKE
jgi:hypothetical protein